MISRARLLIAVLAVLAALAAGAGVARAAPMGHSCAGMVMDDCPDHHGGGDLASACFNTVCATAPPLAPACREMSPPPALYIKTGPLAHTDRAPHDLRGPPDLRPPIL